MVLVEVKVKPAEVGAIATRGRVSQGDLVTAKAGAVVKVEEGRK